MSSNERHNITAIVSERGSVVSAHFGVHHGLQATSPLCLIPWSVSLSPRRSGCVSPCLYKVDINNVGGKSDSGELPMVSCLGSQKAPGTRLIHVLTKDGCGVEFCSGPLRARLYIGCPRSRGAVYGFGQKAGGR